MTAGAGWGNAQAAPDGLPYHRIQEAGRPGVWRPLVGLLLMALGFVAFAIFLEWEGARLQPEEIRLGVIVTILGVFLTRIVAIVRGAKGWSYV